MPIPLLQDVKLRMISHFLSCIASLRNASLIVVPIISTRLGIPMNTEPETQNKPINESTIEQLRNRNLSKQNKMTTNRAALSLLFILILVIGLAAGLMMLRNQKSTQTDTQAFGSVDLSLSTTPSTINAGDPLVVNVLMQTNGEQVSALELHLDYDQTKFEIDSSKASPLTREGYFTSTLPNCKADSTATPCPSASFVDTANGLATIYLGVTCSDNGTPNNPADDTCDTPSQSSNPIVIAKLYLKAKANASGIGNIKFKMPASNQDYAACIAANNGVYTDACEGTWVASLNNDNNRGKDTLFTYALPITILAGTGPTVCDADINQDGTVTTGDYSILRGNFLLNPLNNIRADINKDGSVTTGDYSILRGFFLQSCQ